MTVRCPPLPAPGPWSFVGTRYKRDTVNLSLLSPLRLSSASDLHSRIKLLEDATTAPCRAELQRRPSHCQVEPPLPHPAAASSIDSIVEVLDPLCLQQVAAGLDTSLELALCCQTCTDFRQACQLPKQSGRSGLSCVAELGCPADEFADGTPKMRIPLQLAEDMSPTDADAALWPAAVHVPPQTDVIKLELSQHTRVGGPPCLPAGKGSSTRARRHDQTRSRR